MMSETGAESVPSQNGGDVRLIHTSDWHFGKRFLETDMLPHQERFCDWLVDLVISEEIDCVLVAGDVYDRANPKDDAVELLDDVLHRISSAGASIVMISGNHDSAERLHFGTRFMSGSGLHIRTERRNVADIAEPLTVTGRDGTDVEILPLPYLDPERVVLAAGMQRNHESVLRAVIDNQVSRLRDPSRTVAMAHAFVTGGAPSDSERTLSVAGTGSVPADLFDAFGYVALGHLHRPQVMGDGRLVYSGTPMPYSFSEQHHKSVRIVSVASAGITSEVVPVTTCRPVVTIEGTIDDVLSSSEHSSHEGSFVRVRLTDTNLQVGAMDRLRQRFPHVLEMEQIALTQQAFIDAERLKELGRRSEEEVVREYVNDTWHEGLGDFGESFLNAVLADVVKGDRS